jgi:hypothetical protein
VSEYCFRRILVTLSKAIQLNRSPCPRSSERTNVSPAAGLYSSGTDNKSAGGGGRIGTPKIASENENANHGALSAAFERLIMVTRGSISQPYSDYSPYSSHLESVAAFPNPTAEERAEAQARELEAQRRHEEARKSHTGRLRQRRRGQNAASHRRKVGFHRMASGQAIEFLEDAPNLMIRKGVKYVVAEMSSGKSGITDSRGWYTVESIVTLRTAKCRPVAV